MQRSFLQSTSLRERSRSKGRLRSRVVYAGLTLAVVAAGLWLRSGSVQLPAPVVKYGGDALWALMVFFGFGLLLPRLSTATLTCLALGFSWGIEFSQLYHAPWIDAVRATLPGRLVLGSTFNWPDLPAYALGIFVGALAESRFAERRAFSRQSDPDPWKRSQSRLGSKRNGHEKRLPSLGASLLMLIGLIVLTFCAPLAGVVSPPGDWYASLAKPTWNPPAWVFGPVWTALYFIMAIAAWLVWRRDGWSGAMWLYLLQLGLNASWTPVFFAAQQPGWAFAVIVALWCGILVTMLAFRRVSRLAGWLLLPYLAWVSFAAVLNFTLWRMNPG